MFYGQACHVIEEHLYGENLLTGLVVPPGVVQRVFVDNHIILKLFVYWPPFYTDYLYYYIEQLHV